MARPPEKSSTSQSPGATPATPATPGATPTDPPFDAAVAAEVAEALAAVVRRHPELRSVAAVLDYHHGLNRTGARAAVCVGEGGPAPRTREELFGLDEQAGRLRAWLHRLMGEAAEASRQQEAVRLTETVRLARLADELESRPGGQGHGGPRPEPPPEGESVETERGP